MTKYGKQRGYALLMVLAISVLGASFSALQFKEVADETTVEQREHLIMQTAKQTLDFSLAVTQLMTGIGAVPGEIVTVQDLRDVKLLNNGFPLYVAFGQQMKAYYVTSPENNNVVDVLITISGKPLEEDMRQFGVSDNTLETFYSDVIEKGQEMGYQAEEDSEEFYVGVISKDGNTLHASEDIDISHINKNNDSTTFGIYAKAPNQTGWWRMQVGPYLWQPSPKVDLVNDPDEKLRLSIFGPQNNEVVNDGFSYYCPDIYEKIYFGEEKTFQYNDLVANDNRNFYFCIQTYKGTVNANLRSTPSMQLINPLKSTDPEPAESNPDMWGRCAIFIMYYNVSPLEYKERCAKDETQLKMMTNSYLIEGLNNNVTVNSWDMMQGNTTYQSMYKEEHKNKADFRIPNGIFGDGIIVKVDDRFVQAYHMTSTFVTGGNDGDAYDPAIHHINKLSAMGVIVSNREPSTESITLQEEYDDGTGTIRKMNITIPTPATQ